MYVYLFIIILLVILSISLIINKVWVLVQFSDILTYTVEVSIESTNTTIFIQLVLLVRLLILFYSIYYMGVDLLLEYYLCMIFIFILSILFLLLASNWVSILLGWEGLGIRSFFLINHSRSWERYGNSITTLITIRLGDILIFLFFSGFLYRSYFNMSLLNRVRALLFVLFAITKSALFPFRGWLPKAISAPTPTRALVHRSTLVTAGLVIIIHNTPILLSVGAISLIIITGLLTMVVGRVLALNEIRVKKVVAYRTLSQIGLGIIVYGRGFLYLGFINLICHGFAKRLLFMCVGYVMHIKFNQQNTRKWGDVGLEGLLRLHLTVALFSLCGISYTSGMLIKEAILDGIISSTWTLFVIILTNVRIYLTFLYCYLIYKRLFRDHLTPVQCNQKRAIIFFIVSLETVVVVVYGSFIMNNVLYINPSFSYLEVLNPLLIVRLAVGFYYLNTTVDLFIGGLNTVVRILSNHQHYGWLKPPLRHVATILDRLLYYLTGEVGKSSLVYGFYLKTGLVGKYNTMVLFITLLILLSL